MTSRFNGAVNHMVMGESAHRLRQHSTASSALKFTQQNIMLANGDGDVFDLSH